MAEEADDNVSEETEGENEEEGEGGSKKKLSGKTIILFIVAPAIVLIGVAYLVFSMFLSGPKEEEIAEHEGEGAHAEESQEEIFVFYELPAILVNLNTGGNGKSYLKLKVSIELSSAEDIAIVEPLMPRVLDRFQVYLRELRVSELAGSGGMFQLKHELLRRINLAVPIEVRDVLFTEMIVQ